MINIINDDNVTLSDLQSKIDEINRYLEDSKKDLEETIYNNNVEQYKIDDSIYYKKNKVYDYTINNSTIKNLTGVVNLDNTTLNVNGHVLSNKSIDSVKFLTEKSNTYTWTEVPVSKQIDITYFHEINIIISDGSTYSPLFIVKEDGLYKDRYGIVEIKIIDNNLIIDNVYNVVKIFVR